MPKLTKRSRSQSRLTRSTSDEIAALATGMHYEIVPMKSIEEAINALPPGANVSITCSAARGIAVTMDYTQRLVASGFAVVPHLAARMVESPEQATELAAQVRDLNLDEVYIIAGDAPEPMGPYPGTLEFLHDFLAAKPGVKRVGVAGYPDGHASIPANVLDHHLLAKQEVLNEFGIGGWISTQMCFDNDQTHSWIAGERARGVTLPIRLGIPGVVDSTRLLKMGTRLGIGTSLRFLSKNRAAVTRLMAPGKYDPTDIVAFFAHDAAELGIESLHCFTFNAVQGTRTWQEGL